MCMYIYMSEDKNTINIVSHRGQRLLNAKLGWCRKNDIHDNKSKAWMKFILCTLFHLSECKKSRTLLFYSQTWKFVFIECPHRRHSKESLSLLFCFPGSILMHTVDNSHTIVMYTFVVICYKIETPIFFQTVKNELKIEYIMRL